MNLQELKKKYSGQAVPEWELKALEKPEKPRVGRPPKPAEADEAAQ